MSGITLCGLRLCFGTGLCGEREKSVVFKLIYIVTGDGIPVQVLTWLPNTGADPIFL